MGPSRGHRTADTGEEAAARSLAADTAAGAVHSLMAASADGGTGYGTGCGTAVRSTAGKMDHRTADTA